MLLALIALVAWICIWFYVATRVFRRQDIGMGGKVLWIAVILVFPLVGMFGYFLWDASRRSSPA